MSSAPSSFKRMSSFMPTDAPPPYSWEDEHPQEICGPRNQMNSEGTRQRYQSPRSSSDRDSSRSVSEGTDTRSLQGRYHPPRRSRRREVVYPVCTEVGVSYSTFPIQDSRYEEESSGKDGFPKNVLIPALLFSDACAISRRTLGKKYNVVDISSDAVWHYSITTTLESREESVGIKPFIGGMTDQKENRIPPASMWDCFVPISQSKKPRPFQIPGTERIVQCRSCSGKGKTKCYRCEGEGSHHCYTCHGVGRTNHNERRLVMKMVDGKYRQESEPVSRSVTCHHCGGMGNAICDFCHGTCKEACLSCCQSGKTVTFKQITVKHQTLSDDHFTESRIPHDRLRQCGGLPVCKPRRKDCTLTPVHIRDCLSKRVEEVSKELVAKHRSTSDDSVIREQVHSVQMIPVYRITAEKLCRRSSQRTKSKIFWVIGTKKTVYHPALDKRSLPCKFISKIFKPSSW